MSDYHEFKPLLQEIQERPVNPLGRIIFWILIAIFCVTIGWLCLGQVDIVVTAQGKFIPQGMVKYVQPLETGVLKQIAVKEGDYVHKGQLLMEIDPSTMDPPLTSTQQEIAYTQEEMARIEQQLGSPSDKGVSSATQQALGSSSRLAMESQLSAKQSELAQVKEQLASAHVDAEQNSKLLTDTQAKLARLEAVEDLIARNQLDSLKQDEINYSHRLSAAKLKQQELAQKQQQIHCEISSIHANFNASTLKELADKEKQLIGLTSKSQEFEFRRKKQRLLSPVDGYIDEIFIHTQGGIVTPAQRVLSIVPVSTPLIVEASVLNKDIGYVRSGMPAALKVETFDFQKYGMLDGKVIHISRYSHQDKTQGYLYTIWVKPFSTQLTIDGRKTQMQPGMTVTTEVKVGKRRIIEFFIYPLIKYMHEGLSVR